MDNMKDLYHRMMVAGGFVPEKSVSPDNKQFTLSPEKGQGKFTIYFYEDMFEIAVRDFLFYEDFFLECPMPEFLSITYYTSVSGEEFHPYRQLSPGGLYATIGDGGSRRYQALFHGRIPIRSVGIEIMPIFYREYLRQKFPGESVDLREAFAQVAVKTEFPKLMSLLKQIQHYSGSSLAAKMFYEGKVLETLALIIERAKAGAIKRKAALSGEDKENLRVVAAYIDNHYAFPVPMERLCRIAFMGGTKLKSAFREQYGCSISDYIIQRKIEQAQHLLLETELPIGEISKVVGYERTDSFSKQFHKMTGLLPREYRGLAKR